MASRVFAGVVQLSVAIGCLAAPQGAPAVAKRVDVLTASTLFLQVHAGRTQLAAASGFVVKEKEEYFLITNAHVLTGRNAETRKLLLEKEPTAVAIRHHGKQLGTWSWQVEELFAGEQKRWLEHPSIQAVDVVALPLQVIPPDRINLYPLDYARLADADIDLQPALAVSVVGYPLGLAGPSDFAIWKTGHVASDPDLDFGGKPRFLIDATTRSGMSGSPVYLRSFGSHLTRSGSTAVHPGIAERFLGVYSGRIHSDSEIGTVWKPSVISEILANR